MDTSYRLYLGDCLDIMPTLEAQSVDLILADLPYGTTACAWDVIIPFKKLWKEYRRIIKPNHAIVLFASQPFTSLLVVSNLRQFKYAYVWKKSRPSNFHHAKNAPLKSHEDILVFSDGIIAHENVSKRMPYFPQGLIGYRQVANGTRKGGSNDAHRFGRPSNKSKYVREFVNYPESVLYFESESRLVHPTQKPVALIEWLIGTYTVEGETVLDNTVGSGTTGEAAIRTGRKFIGIEKEPKFYRVAETRLQQAQPPLPLGATQQPHQADATSATLR